MFMASKLFSPHINNLTFAKCIDRWLPCQKIATIAQQNNIRV